MDKKYWGIVLVSPLVILYSVLIIGGLSKIVIESLGYIPTLGFENITLTYYKDAVLAKGFFSSLIYSAYLALTATIVSVILGVLLGYYLVMTQNVVLKKMVNRIIQVGIVMPYLYMVFIVTLLFSQSGIVSRILFQIGVIEKVTQFPTLIYNFGGTGIILVFILKGIPFVTLLTVNVMSNISELYKDVAKTLGCNNLRTLRKIYLPLSSNVIVWSAAVLFAYDLGSYEVPYLLGSLKPKAFSVKLFSSYISPQIENIPTTMAMTIILFLVGVVLSITLTYLLKQLFLSKYFGGCK